MYAYFQHAYLKHFLRHRELATGSTTSAAEGNDSAIIPHKFFCFMGRPWSPCSPKDIIVRYKQHLHSDVVEQEEKTLK